MGLLSEGRPLSWAETKAKAWIVHKYGLEQFISLYKRLKDRKGDTLKWGDEIEYNLIHIDEEKQTVHSNCLGPALLEQLLEITANDPDHEARWSPEYASFMIEGTPGPGPYGGCYQDFNWVETNMKRRREILYELLKDTNTIPMSIVVNPRIGCPGFMKPHHDPKPDTSASRSLFYPDEAIWKGHPRFATLTRNIRERRGEKVAINMPIYKDTHTPTPFVEPGVHDEFSAALPDHIYMDAMGFGMSCCCLQVTFQACDIDEARQLYDQLAIMCPILLAMSASTPIFRGYLSDNDVRWNSIKGAVDCRTREERGLTPLKEDKFVIPTSRYDTIDLYLAHPEYNDKEILYEEEDYKKLRDSGIDHVLAQHVAHLFIRSTVSLFEEKAKVTDVENDSDHFENIQSTNWQSMRFKPPPPNSKIGWRVEFRPLDIQLTDFENAAFVVFVVLLTRAILSFKLNLMIPISKMQENMQRATHRDAVNKGMFYFRHQLVPEDDDKDNEEEEEGQGGAKAASQSGSATKSHDDEYTQMSINTIMNGKDEFPGVIPLVRMYVNSINVDVDTRCTIMQYLKLISKRASGELMTTATWMRNFVTTHPDYHHDSVVSEKINYDLITKLRDISEGRCSYPELLGKLSSMAIPKRPKCPSQSASTSDPVTSSSSSTATPIAAP